MKVAVYEAGSGASNSSFPPRPKKHQPCWILTLDDLSLPAPRNVTVSSCSVSQLFSGTLWQQSKQVEAGSFREMLRSRMLQHTWRPSFVEAVADTHLNIGVGLTWAMDRMRKTDLTYISEGFCQPLNGT